MAKKQMVSVPFHQIHVRVAGDAIRCTFQKRVKGGKLNLGQCVISRKDPAPGLTSFVEIHEELAHWE